MTNEQFDILKAYIKGLVGQEVVRIGLVHASFADKETIHKYIQELEVTVRNALVTK